MNRALLLLLPGLDGTGSLFWPFLNALPGDIVAEAVTFPQSELLDFD